MTSGHDRLVTIAMPVRNGAATLRHALDSLLRQTHRDIQIVVCDNASTDETPDIVREYADRDDRVRHVRREEAVSAIQNWRIAYEQVDSRYFMWAADDDVRADDAVEVLLEALEREPAAGLAFGDVVKFRDYARRLEQPVYPYACDTRGMGVARRLFMDKNGPFAPYGLFRTEVLTGYRWYDHTVSPDWPLFIYVLARTDIVQVDGATFYYKEPEVAVSAVDRARNQSYREMETCPTARLSWRCALAARDAARDRGSTRVVPVDFLIVFAGLLWANRHSIWKWALKRY